MENINSSEEISIKEKFQELKSNISSFLEEEKDKVPLGEKVKHILEGRYDKLLSEEISELSDYAINDVLKNLVHKYVKDDTTFNVDNNFSDFYDKYIKNLNEEFDLDMEELEENLVKYSNHLITVSENIKNYEKELLDFFVVLDNIKKWISNIPETIKVNEDEIYSQIKDLENDEKIKDLIKKYKEERIKYHYLRHNFFINPFLCLAKDNSTLYSSEKTKVINDLDEESDQEEVEVEEEEVGFIRSIIRWLY
jgi:hypothetical protein